MLNLIMHGQPCRAVIGHRLDIDVSRVSHIDIGGLTHNVFDVLPG